MRRPGGIIVSIFTPHGGCPERCRFCDQRTSGGAPVAAAHVTGEIRRQLATRRSSSVPAQVAFYGGTFTAMPAERQLAYLEAVRPFLESGEARSVRISTRPDALDPDWLMKLRDAYRLSTVELGAQTFNPQALEALGRSHSVESIGKGVAVLRGLGLEVGLHLMVGVPREAPDEDEDTSEQVMRLRPDFVRIHPLLVLKGTALERDWAAGRVRPLDLEAAVERCARLTKVIEEAGIRVIRLGLQPNEELGIAVVAGPYHPAFGDLVRGRIWRNRIREKLDARGAKEGANVELVIPAAAAGTVRGPRSANIGWLRERFGYHSLTVRVRSGRMVEEGDDLEIRVHDPARPPQRRKIEPPQPPGRRGARYRDPQAPDDLADGPGLRPAPRS